MTAIVGVLNKHAIAVAADSAETVGEGLKIYDKANKIFTLSKHHPVGIAIYNNAAFNSLIPWEIIIKMYRRQLGEKPFNTLKEYVSDFIKYLENFHSSHLTKDELDAVTCDEVMDFWLSEVVNKLPNKKSDTSDIAPDDISALEGLLTTFKARALAEAKIPELSNLDYASFSACIKKGFLTPILTQIIKVGGDKQLFSTLVPETLYEIFTRQVVSRPSYSGLAFFGYGEEEIYPALYEILVFNSFVGKLYWREERVRAVSNHGMAFIHPMAQTDVMQTYIEGISPQIEDTFRQITEDTMRNFLSNLKKIVKPNPALSAAIGNINLAPFMDYFQNSVDQFKKVATIRPLMATVSTMEKEDLAELAENLIYLTSLKRRITPNLESVGGPVDVAIVSKGDGFIWLKRKHYFDPQLNRVYFDKYFKS